MELERQSFLDALKKFTGIILVEGRKDVEALNELGFKNVKALKRKALTRFVESLDNKNVALLMDTDKEGRKLTKKLVTLLQDKGFRVTKKYWYWLKNLKISHVEGLA